MGMASQTVKYFTNKNSFLLLPVCPSYILFFSFFRLDATRAEIWFSIGLFNLQLLRNTIYVIDLYMLYLFNNIKTNCPNQSDSHVFYGVPKCDWSSVQNKLPTKLIFVTSCINIAGIGTQSNIFVHTFVLVWTSIDGVVFTVEIVSFSHWRPTIDVLYDCLSFSLFNQTN